MSTQDKLHENEQNLAIEKRVTYQSTESMFDEPGRDAT